MSECNRTESVSETGDGYVSVNSKQEAGAAEMQPWLPIVSLCTVWVKKNMTLNIGEHLKHQKLSLIFCIWHGRVVTQFRCDDSTIRVFTAEFSSENRLRYVIVITKYQVGHVSSSHSVYYEEDIVCHGVKRDDERFGRGWARLEQIVIHQSSSWYPGLPGKFSSKLCVCVCVCKYADLIHSLVSQLMLFQSRCHWRDLVDSLCAAIYSHWIDSMTLSICRCRAFWETS